MDEGKGWLRSNWRTAMILVLIFGLALFLRVYFVSNLALTSAPADCTAIYTPPFSGGSDSYYEDHTLCYSFHTGRDLVTDPMLNYPLSSSNPRLPLYPWFSLLVGRLIAPLFSGSAWPPVYYTFLLSAAFFGALTVFPTYALAKEAFGRKVGLVSAFLLAISAGHLQRSITTDGRTAAFTLFFIVATFYFFLRALKSMKRRRWVENWFRRDSIIAGMRGFTGENRNSVLYALLAGLSLATVALAWQGWAYVYVILLLWFGVESFLDRLRNEDAMGMWILFTIALATPLVLAFQWYSVHSQIRVWFDVPTYLFLATFVFGLAVTVTRDYPWTLVIPGVLIAGAVGLGVGASVNPTVANAFFTGAGYFVQSKVVTTIAEQQAPGMSQIILAFGVATFGLGLLAVVYMVWQVPRRRDPAFSLVVIWVAAAMFMAMTAARFIFNASPAFAIASAFAIDQLLVRADFATMRRTYRSLSGGSWRNAVRKSIKVRHVLTVVLLAFLVLLPNVWFAVDSAIPFELKSSYDRQVANLLPSFLRAPGYGSSSGPFYFGAFGYSLPKPTDYYPAAWNWFATQDAGVPPELRPAFLSWWDYGFEAVDRGVHPTVADNFQLGLQLAGQFITAQNETESVALLTIRLLEGNYWQNHRDLSPVVRAALASYDLTPITFTTAFAHPADLVPLVLSDSVTYGPWAADMNPLNAQYIYLTHYLTGRLNEEGCAALYHAVRDATGRDIGYFAVDSRLFPISDTNTGIFYAPVKLSDHRVLQLPDGRVLPFEYFQILANTTTATDLPIQFVPAGAQIQSERIQYQPAFYNSMFYRAYIGYTPTDLGLPTDKGIPGFDQLLRGAPPVPAWNLTHWREVYRTAYYNPFTDVANHTDAWRAMNYDQAQRMQAQIQAGTITGVVDRSTQTAVANGVVFLRYYDGAWVNGTVRSGSQPVSGVRITVTDELGTPHYVTTTDAQGHYSALVPFGTITITASIGNVTRTTLVGSRTLATLTVPVTLDQAMRVPADLNGDGVPDWLMTRDLQVAGHVAHGSVYFDLNRNGVLDASDAVLQGATVTFTNTEFRYNRTGTSAADGSVAIASLVEGPYAISVRANGRTVQSASVNIAATDATHDIAVPFVRLRGYATASGGSRLAGAAVEVLDETNGTTIPLTTRNDGFYSVEPLMPGNYTITASSGDLTSMPARTRSLQADLWFNLTLVPSGAIAGATTLYGTSQPFAGLQFQSATNPRLVRTATSDAAGQYSIRLSAGEWFVTGRVYDGAALYATLGDVVVTTGRTSAYNAMFVQGARVTGIVSGPGLVARAPGATLAFSNNAGQLWITSDASGRYLAFLPTGTYNLEAFEIDGAFFESVPVMASRSLDVGLVATSESVTWIVYRDANGNGILDVREGIAGAHVTLTDDRGAHIVLTTNVTGQFRIPFFANRTYSGVVDALGFTSRVIPASSPSALRALIPVALVPVPVDVRGSLITNGSAILNHPLRVQAVATGSGAVTQSTLSDTNGGYALTLVPGTYELVVDENVSTTRATRYQNLASDRIVVAVGASALAADVAIVVRDLVIGNVTRGGVAESASLTFDGPEQRTVNATTSGFETYLIPGTYAVGGNRTIAPDVYAFITSVTVPVAGNLSLALAKATVVTGRALVDGVPVPGPMPVTFARQGGGLVRVSTDPTGSYIAYLAAGDYTVTLAGTNSATQGNVSRFYRYVFSGTATVPSGTTGLTLDLFPTRTLDNTTVFGTVRLGGAGVDATINFYARDGGAIGVSASAASNGAYAVSLSPGTYDMYATRGFGGGVFLGRIAIPHVGSVGRDIALGNGFVLAGVTTDPSGFGTSAAITIRSQAEIDLASAANGAYSALLPSGTYTITATKAGTENGIPVTYRSTTSVSLNADMIANLALSKVVVRSAALSWDASQRRQIASGDSVTYTIIVRNTGTVADTMSLAGQPSSWQFSFAPASVSLNFGTAANSSAVQVTITSPASALVDHGPITVVATSATDGSTLGSVGVGIDILRTRGLALSFNPTTAVFDGHFLNYTLAIKNSGNAAETVNAGITNPDDLAALGWTVRLRTSSGVGGNLTLTGISVPANSTTNLRVQAQSPSGPSGATVVVEVSAQDSMAVSATGVFPLLLPQLSPGGVSVGGPDVAAQPPPNYPLLAVVAGAVAAIAAGLYLTRRRR